MKTQAFKFAPRSSGGRARRIFVGVLAALLMGALLFPTGAGANNGKRDVCHATGSGTYQKINISENAFQQHVSHGDAAPGDPVPGRVGYKFDGSCVPVLAVIDTDGDGVADDQDNCPNVANSDQSNRYGSAKGDACEDDSNGDGTLDANESDICIHIDGVEIRRSGSSTCASRATTGTRPNIAIATGPNAHAYAGVGRIVLTGEPDDLGEEADNNTAIADGINARAWALDGVNNTAFADGDYGTAWAFDGDNNAATATNTGLHLYPTNGARAHVQNGNNNRATATGTTTLAQASGGDNNTSNAIGNTSTDVAVATTGGGNNNTATATGINADDGFGTYANAGLGNYNTATATGRAAQALAGFNGTNNIANANGDFTRALAQATAGCTAENSVSNTTVTCN